MLSSSVRPVGCAAFLGLGAWVPVFLAGVGGGGLVAAGEGLPAGGWSPETQDL